MCESFAAFRTDEVRRVLSLSARAEMRLIRPLRRAAASCSSPLQPSMAPRTSVAGQQRTISSSGRPSSRNNRLKQVQTPRRTPRTPSPPPTPHVSAGLVSLDSFYALHRPLLELPITLSSRRSVSVASTTPSNSADIDSRAAELEREAIEEFVRAVDLSKDHMPQIGNVAKASTVAEYEQLPEQEEEDDLLDPSSSWVEQSPEDLPSPVRQYLAAQMPFSAPSASASKSRQQDASNTSSALSFLRPFRIRNLPQDTLTPSTAYDMATSFLSSAQAMNAWKSHAKTSPVLEQLEKARRKLSSSSTDDQAFGRRKRHQVKVWTEKEGWQQVNVLPSDKLDMAWIDDGTATVDVVVQVDSVKRKRKKAMRKHKYKKRRFVLFSPSQPFHELMIWFTESCRGQ